MFVVTAALAPLLGISLVIAHDQFVGWSLSRAAAAVLAGSGSADDLRAAALACRDRCSPGALLDGAAAFGALATREPSLSRRGDLDGGLRMSTRALELRPESGLAWTERAYLETLSPASSDARVASLLSRSYARSTFLPRAGLWRTGWAAAHWGTLADADVLRGRVLDEAEWLQSVPEERGGRADGGLGDGVAAVELSLRPRTLAN